MLLVLGGSLAVLFLWGVVSPRSQWRVLASWTYRDPHANEPAGTAYVLYRLIAALGIIAMIVSAVGVRNALTEAEPPPNAPPTAVDLMWGTPNPVVLNRVITPETRAPKGYVVQPILGYQAVDSKRRQPPYLFSLGTLSLDTATTRSGLVGVDPPTGLTALDTAQLVVEVAGDPVCFPHHVVVLETESTVKIAVYYGQPLPEDGDGAAELAECETKTSGVSVKTLIPIRLSNGLGTREVQTVAGEPIPEVPVRE